MFGAKGNPTSGRSGVWARIGILATMFALGSFTEGCECDHSYEHAPDAQMPGVFMFSGGSTIDVSAYALQVQVTIQRAGGIIGAVSVDWATQDVLSATVADGDYVAANGTLSWAAGVLGGQTVTVQIPPDMVIDGNEFFDIVLSNPQGGAALGGPSTVRVNIIETWTKYAQNPVLPRGITGLWDSGAVEAPSVLKQGLNYHMWYEGASAQTTGDSFGRAISTQGIGWTKNMANPLFGPAGGGAFDSDTLFNPCVVFDGAVYHNWYTGLSGNTRAIGYATSNDGTTWTRQNGGNAVLGPSGAGWDATQTAFCSVIDEGTQYRMFYSGSGGGAWQIGMATSTNGTAWTRYAGNPVMTLLQGFELGGALSPWVIADGANYWMVYSGIDSGTGYLKIGFAMSTDSGQTWNKFQGNPIITTGTGWESQEVGWCCLLKDTNDFKIWYSGGAPPAGATDPPWDIGLATNP